MTFGATCTLPSQLLSPVTLLQSGYISTSQDEQHAHQSLCVIGPLTHLEDIRSEDA